MYPRNDVQRWPVRKYKQIKRDGREEYTDVEVQVDENKKRLTVTCAMEELEQIYYNMEVNRYPILKMKDVMLYVMVNGQGQGFRLTLREADRQVFFDYMRTRAYITETPEKRPHSYSAQSTNRWSSSTVNATSSSHQFSFSQPYPPTEEVVQPNRSACRNLSQEISGGFEDRLFMSQPTNFYNYQPSSPFSQYSSSSSSSSRSSSTSSRYSSHFDDPFSGFSQSSNDSPTSSSSRSSSRSSSSFPQYYPDSQDSSPFSGSQQSSDPFTQPSDPPQMEHKCVQTDGPVMSDKEIISQLMSDPKNISRFVNRAFRDSRMLDVIENMRAVIRKLPKETVEEMRKKTEPSINFDAPLNNQPTVAHQNSDVEF